MYELCDVWHVCVVYGVDACVVFMMDSSGMCSVFLHVWAVWYACCVVCVVCVVDSVHEFGVVCVHWCCVVCDACVFCVVCMVCGMQGRYVCAVYLCGVWYAYVGCVW